MRKILKTVAAAGLAAMAGACADVPTAPDSGQLTGLNTQQHEGTGLILDNLTGINLPVVGEVAGVDIDQANITRLILVEDAVGNIVGLEAEGVLRLTGGVLGTDVVTEDFRTQVLIASSGRGQCDVVTVALAPFTVDAAFGLVEVDVPQAEVTPSASGALGPLLCNVGQLLQFPIDAGTGAVRGLINAINRILI